jgi:hypothetical protein
VLISKLKELQLERGADFTDFKDFEVWADQVEPLLSLSPKHEAEFSKAKLRAVTSFRMKSHKSTVYNTDEAIGVLNKAISFLEIPKSKECIVESELVYPDKITLPWLKKHIEVKQWIYVVGLLVSIFLAGVAFGDSKFYQDYFKKPINKTDSSKNV